MDEKRYLIPSYMFSKYPECFYCKRPLLETQESFLVFSWDHLISKQDGGTDTDKNLVQSCKPCNSSKGKKSFHKGSAELKKFQKYRQITRKRDDWFYKETFAEIAYFNTANALQPKLLLEKLSIRGIPGLEVSRYRKKWLLLRDCRYGGILDWYYSPIDTRLQFETLHKLSINNIITIPKVLEDRGYISQRTWNSEACMAWIPYTFTVDRTIKRIKEEMEWVYQHIDESLMKKLIQIKLK